MIEINGSLFSGDFIFSGTIGRFDFPMSNASDMKKAFKNFEWEDNYHIYPGHGSKTTLSNEVQTIKQWEKYIKRKDICNILVN